MSGETGKRPAPDTDGTANGTLSFSCPNRARARKERARCAAPGPRTCCPLTGTVQTVMS